MSGLLAPQLNPQRNGTIQLSEIVPARPFLLMKCSRSVFLFRLTLATGSAKFRVWRENNVRAPSLRTARTSGNLG